MAEGVGFEPTVGCPTLDFESSALNRTQPPFPGSKRTSNPPTLKASAWQALNVRHPTSNRKPHFEIGREADNPVCRRAKVPSQGHRRLVARHPKFASRRCPRRQEFRHQTLKKCYNFRLATVLFGTAYCVSARTATLLLGVDWNSQVVSAAVHRYSPHIKNLNPPSPP
jgi:hypothetical protein